MLPPRAEKSPPFLPNVGQLARHFHNATFLFLNLHRRLAVKRYHEMLTDMNARQMARLDAAQVAAFNRVFRQHRNVLAYFGYDLMDWVR